MAEELNSKAGLRAAALRARDALSPAARHDLSLRIAARIRALAAWRDAQCVLLYASFGSEFDTGALIADALAAGKSLCLPRAIAATRALDIHTVCDPARELTPGRHGIREPVITCPQPALTSVDFVLVPGVAFTPYCTRLGYGGGYYDRTLAQLRREKSVTAIGIAFAGQWIEKVPADAGDQPLDAVLDERGFHPITWPLSAI